MHKTGTKPIIGILGGIGSGKTTVANAFAKAGCKVIDADKIAHELLEQKDVKSSIINIFGKAILTIEGKINRKKLADVVFEDSGKIKAINGIIHPLVLAQVEALISEYNTQNQVKAIVLDMPLLAEVGWEKRCNKLIFVDCKADLRLKRTMKNGILNESQLKRRENFQISLDKKKSIADNVLDNNSDCEALAKRVADILSDVVNNG
jgi:dephospho-CoA kinase